MTRTTAESFPEARNWTIRGSNKQEGLIVTSLLLEAHLSMLLSTDYNILIGNFIFLMTFPFIM